MSIHPTKTPLTYHYLLNNHILEQVNENPYFCLIISDNLKWSAQINKMCNKANSTLGFIRRNLKHCNENSKNSIYIPSSFCSGLLSNCMWPILAGRYRQNRRYSVICAHTPWIVSAQRLSHFPEYYRYRCCLSRPPPVSVPVSRRYPPMFCRCTTSYEV